MQMLKQEHQGEEHGWKNLLGLFFKHETPRELVSSQIVAIAKDSYCSFCIRMVQFETLKLDIEVLEGGEIDILTMNDYNFGRYIRAEPFVYIVTGSILKIKKVSNIFVAPEDCVYHIVLDNTFYPPEGAMPKANINEGFVKVRYTLRSRSQVQFDESYLVR